MKFHGVILMADEPDNKTDERIYVERMDGGGVVLSDHLAMVEGGACGQCIAVSASQIEPLIGALQMLKD